MAEAQLIPVKPFQRLVKEVSDEVSTRNGLRWERDAVFALQECTEHVLVMLFEMTYYMLVISLILRNQLAIHAKCQTIKPHDMALLRSLWERIDPKSAIGADDGTRSRQIATFRRQEAKRMAIAKQSAEASPARARQNGTVDALPAGVRNFCRQYCGL